MFRLNVPAGTSFCPQMHFYSFIEVIRLPSPVCKWRSMACGSHLHLVGVYLINNFGDFSYSFPSNSWIILLTQQTDHCVSFVSVGFIQSFCLFNHSKGRNWSNCPWWGLLCTHGQLLRPVLKISQQQTQTQILAPRLLFIKRQAFYSCLFSIHGFT